ncbi:MAG: ferrous iron transport protein B [Pirellulaceae bacterium]|nr:ferrous iron transport protein B [Pirellulaceae bacterium]
MTHRDITIALIGNPNTGKSSLFNALCGMNARVGNFPGVTVEKKVGKYDDGQGEVTVIDLPGTYSLSARSADEMVSVDVLLGESKELSPIDCIVVVLDATHVERNLYLYSQVNELERPVMVVLNMWDRVATSGVSIDVAALSAKLGVPVVTTSANKRVGTSELKEAIRSCLANATVSKPAVLFPEVFKNEVRELSDWIQSRGRSIRTYAVERLLLDSGGLGEKRWASTPGMGDLRSKLQAARKRLAENDCRVPAIETRVRYAWVQSIAEGVILRDQNHRVTSSDRIDRVLTHRWWGMTIFACLMFVVFQLVFIDMGDYSASSLIENGLSWMASIVESLIPPGAFRSLVNDGVIAGVGGVLVFIPQIAIFFVLIAVLEDCGYMARVALLMDKWMTRLGLNGKAFLPLMTSFGCAVPGIMATRTIENRRDRMVTILVAPLMSCSARLPVYTLMITTFIPGTAYLGGWVTLHGLLFLSMYALGAVVAIPIAWLLKCFVFPGQVTPFVLELPEYSWPSWRVVVHRVWEQVRSFIARAGTLILCTSILVWAAGYFPGDHKNEIAMTLDLAAKEQATESDGVSNAENESAIDVLQGKLNETKGELIEVSYLGQFGKVLEPAFHAVGWDWKIGVGVIASFPAREVIIATLGTIYSLGGDVNEESGTLKSQLQASRWPDGRPVFNTVTAISLMVFFALCAQCAATLMTIRHETQTWRWPIFTFVYMTGLAYFAAWLVFVVGSRWS